VFGGVWFDHSCFAVDPRSLYGASRVTCGDTNSWIVSDASYLSRVRIGANEQFPVLFDEPYRGANGVSSFPVCFDADVFLACELGQFVSCGGQLRLTTVEVPLGDADGVAYTN
jgi:hypothetical protein